MTGQFWQTCGGMVSMSSTGFFFPKTGEKSVVSKWRRTAAEILSMVLPLLSRTVCHLLLTFCNSSLFLVLPPFSMCFLPYLQVFGFPSSVKNEKGWGKAACRVAEESLSQPAVKIHLLRRTPEHSWTRSTPRLLMWLPTLSYFDSVIYIWTDHDKCWESAFP